jgi:hypothetical protein
MSALLTYLKPSQVFIIILTLIGMTACKKGTIEPRAESQLDLLTERKWELTNLYQQDVGDNVIVDLRSAYYAACELDDSYHFTKNFSFFRRDSTNKCPTDPRFGLYGGATWSTDSAFSQIRFRSFLGMNSDMEIVTLTADRLELKHFVRDYFNNEMYFTYRLRSIK